MADAPKRRWFQFRLRTLLVGAMLTGAVVGGFVGWQARIVRERKAVLAEVKRLGGSYSSRSPSALEAPDPNWIRQVLGDVPTHFSFVVPLHTTDETIRRIRAAFPYSVVMEFELKNGNWDTIFPPDTDEGD